MPRLAPNEEAFLSFVKSLHKGKGKENVPTNILSVAQTFGKINGINGNFTSAPPQKDIIKEAPWPVSRPPTIDAREDPAETLHVNPLHGEDNAIGETLQPAPSPATYTVVASNFAPGTTAADIDAFLSDEVGPMQDCRLISERPVVMAELVFTEKSRAENVITAFDNKLADGNLLHLYMKPEDTQTPSTAPYDDVRSAQVLQSEQQQPASPILRGRGRSRYNPMSGDAETLLGDEEAATVGMSEKHQVEKMAEETKSEDEEVVWKDCEEHGSAHVGGQEADTEEGNQSKKKDAAQERSWKNSWASKLMNIRNLGLEDEVTRAIRLAEEKTPEGSEATEPFDHSTQQISGLEPVATGQSTTATANNTTVGTSAAADLPTRSRQPSPVPEEAAPPPASGPKSSMPLLSSGHDFLQALSKRPTATDAYRSKPPSLPSDVIADELPTAIATQSTLSNEQVRPSSPLTQIIKTGTLQSPSGDHTIHLAPQPSSIRTTTDISTAELENHWDFFSQYRPDSTVQELPVSLTRHPSDHSALPPRPPHTTTAHAPAFEIRTLTLLSGSGPRGYIYRPRHYDRNELVKIGMAYRQKVFLALLKRQGRARMVLGITESEGL
ncbi:MAG: hypothetical protein Q9221_006184 [Calogaya cf. arnoldii]